MQKEKFFSKISIKTVELIVFVILLVTILLTTVIIWTGYTSSKNVDINAYISIEEESLEPYLAFFKAQYPKINVNITRDSTGIITAKLIAEKDNPQADIIWGLATTSLLVMDKGGMFEGYNPKGIEYIYPEFKDIKNNPAHWVGINAWMIAFTINTIEVEAKV